MNFSYHIKEKMSKAMNRIGVIKQLSNILPQHSLITKYKVLYKDYGDILYDQPNNESVSKN